jgi:nicotinamide-nucleotide amidase
MTTLKEIYAEIVTIGDEILYGQILDTNSTWMCAELDKIGFRIRRTSSISDQESEILEILAEAEQRSDVVLITGGLGPTNDDVTKKTLAQYFDCGMRMHEEALAQVTAFFARKGRTVSEVNQLQAMLPTACTYLPNPLGTAPGMWFEKNGTIIVSMPGVPFEMKGLMLQTVLPKLKQHFHTPAIVHQLIRTTGIGESVLAERIATWENALPAHIRLAYLPSPGEVKLRLTGIHTNADVLKKEIDTLVAQVQPLIADVVFAYNEDPLEKVVGDLLRQHQYTIATAESCTGGYLAHLLTAFAGSSDYFKGSIVAYANEVKQAQLGVQAHTLETHGAVSEQTVVEMANGVRQKLQTSIGIATSGVAGPGGGSAEKPVGTVWLALADGQQTITKKLMLGIQRDNNIRQSAYAALELIRKYLTK